MPTIPLKYCKWIKEGLRYVDSVKKNNVEVTVSYTELSRERIYDIYHYDTLIARLYPCSNVFCLFDGYSKSDCDIINSFLILCGISGKVRRHNGELYIEDERV